MGKIEYRQKLGWLNRYLEHERLLIRLAEEEEKLQYVEGKLTASYSLASTSGGETMSKQEAYAEKKEEVRRRVAETKEAMQKAKKEIEEALQQIVNEDWQRYLWYFYIGGQTGEEVAYLAGYSLKHWERKKEKIVRELRI